MTDFNGLLAQYATTPATEAASKPNDGTDPHYNWGGFGSEAAYRAYTSKQEEEARKVDVANRANGLLDYKKSNVATASEQKKTAMSKPSILPSLDQSYQTAVGGLTGQGRTTMTEYERDIRTMGPNDLRFKYGNRQAAAMMGQANAANQEVILDSGASRTASQAVGNTAVDIGSGFVMPALNIGAFGLGLVNQNAGVSAAQGLSKLNNWTQGLQSDELNQRRKLNEARNALDSRDSKAQQEIDLLNGDGELYAGLKRLGRGAVNAVSNAADDSAILGSGIANGVGSLLSGSVLAKGASLAGKGILGALGKAGVIKSGGPINTGLAGSELGSLVDKAAFPLSIGAMEGAGVYQQTADAIANTPVGQLAKTSETFRGYVANGMTPEQARIQLANRAAITAGTITAPVAAAAGKLVAPFEANPFARASLKTVGQNAGKETLEESIQSGFGAFAQNLANKAVVNPNQSLLDNVGEQAGEGGLYGMGTTAAIAGPSALKNTVSDSSKYLWGKASTAVTESAAKLEASNEAASPLAPNKVAAEVEATQAAMPQVAATIQTGIDTSSLNQEEKTEGQAYAGKLTGALSYGDQESAHLANHPIGAVVAGSKDKAEAMLKLAKFVNENGDAEQGTAAFDAAQELNNYVFDLEEALRSEPASLSKLPNNHPAVVQMKAIKDTLAKVNAQPVVKKALDKIDAMVAAFNASFVAEPEIAAAPVTLSSEVQTAQQLLTAIDKGGIPLNPAKLRVVAESLGLDVNSKANPADTINRIREAVARSVQQTTPTGSATSSITKASLATPEGQQYAQTAANVIAHDPAKANPALVNAVLAHAASGKLVLTNKQQKAVAFAKGLFDTSREDFANRERLGLKTQDIVSNQIQSAEYLAQGQESAVQHATKVYNAYRANDLTAANWHLEDFRKFAESIQNKLAALNEHLNNRRGRRSLNYQTIDQTSREWKTSTDTVGITPTSVGSVEFMQGVAADAKMLAAVYENLKQTFPELNGQELKAVTLDSRIDKPAAEVAAAFKTSVKPAPAVAPKVEPENKASAAIEAAVSPAAVPVAEATDDVAKNDEKVNTSVEPVKEKAKTEQVVQEDGPLPWETDEAFNQRTASPEPVKESIATPAAESLQSIEHDLDAETKLLNTLAKALGVVAVAPITSLQSIQGIGTIRGGIYFGDSAGIGIDDALVGAPRLSVLLHEFGHHVTYNKIAEALGKTAAEVQEMSDKELLTAFEKAVPEIAAEYKTWLADRAVTFDNKGRIRTPLVQSALSRVIYQALTGKEFPIKISPNRISTFHEWVADNIGKALERNTKTQGVVAQLFKSIADAFVKIYEMVSSTKSLQDFMPAKSVGAWLESLMANAEPKKEIKAVAPASLVQMLDGIATGVSSTGPGKFVPNAEQAKGISKIRKFLDDKTGGNIFVLEGKAGTGKTSLIQEAVAPYLKDGGTVVVAAVSHKAKCVLEQKLANFIQSNKLRGKVKAHSVAGLLGMKRDETTGDFVEDPYAESSVDQVQVLVVDEASMVNEQNKRILESRLPANAKLIYLGDRNQIAPIEKKGSPNLGKISQVFTMDTGTNKHSLMTRVRQGEDSTILPYADHYWNNAENDNSVADPIPATDRTNSGELVMLPSLGWVDQVIPLFKKAFAAGNANLVKVMAFNNMENSTSGAVMLRNAERKIREAMFSKDLLEYNKGELLIMTNSFGRGDEKLENSAELLALRSTPTTVDVQAADGSMVTLDAFKLTVEDTITGNTVTVPVVAESSKARHKTIYEGWGNLAKSGQRSAWKMFWEVKEQTFAPVAYSYILTTHKAQGSTYDVAVVLEDNIQTSPDTAANKSRIMYTAITRASKMAVIVSGKNTEQPLIAKPAVEPKKKAEPVATSTPAVAEPIAPVVSSLVQKKNRFSVTPKQTADKKATVKASIATQYIGFGEGIAGSSTELYRQQAGKFANTGNYSDKDVIFVSVAGKRGDAAQRTKQQGRTIYEALRAIESGATLITDNKAYTDNSNYNEGEKRLAGTLLAKGHTYSEVTVDGQLLGVWNQGTKPSSLVQEEKADPVEEEDDSEVTPFVYTGKATGLRDVPEFATLFGGTANRFLDAYKLPADSNPISRISLADDALSTVAKAVSSDSKLQTMMDSHPKPGFSRFAAKTYTQYVSVVGTATLTKLSDNLQDWLAYTPKKGDNAGISRLEQVLASDFVNTWPNGKILNLLQNDNGKLSYDSRLVEGAVLAGLQWLITSESLSSKLKDKDVAAIFGITTDEVPPGKASEMSIGQGETNAVTALASKIQEYWGLESNKDYPINQVSGITGSLAADILAAFKDMGILTIEPFSWEKPPAVVNGKMTRQIKTHNRVVINLAESLGDPDNFKALQSYPDAIEQAVMVKPEQTVYLEDERPDVARTQMRNPGAKNKKQALKAIEVNQDTAYKFTHQYKLYEALAAKGFGKLLQLFGFGELSKDDRANKFNKNHLVAVDGKNQSIVSAILGMDYLNEQVKARAEAVGKAPEEIGVHYAHAPSKVQRLQQIGRVTPQGDKNMRAVLSPHEAVLDLDDTRRKDYKNFLIAIAQAVGIKIHNIKPEIVLPQIQKLLDNELKPAVDVLQDWSKNMDRPIQEDAADIFMQSFKDAGMDFSNLALQSLTEYALYLNAERGKGRTAFPVTLYGEADGITNGPGGAMILHSTGPFTVHSLRMMRKVGYYPGQKDWTAQDQFAADGVDTYGVVASLLKESLPALKSTYNGTSPEAAGQMTHMLNMLDLLFEGNLSFNSDTGALTIKRGAAKSPVTVTIYGAGKQGIASKITGIITEELYKRMSDVAAATYEDPSKDGQTVMFGSTEKYAKFEAAFAALTNNYVGYNKDKNEHFLGKSPSNVEREAKSWHQYAVNFTLSPKEIENITGNVRKLFVEPMDTAIRETMGESLMSSMELIRQATQIQSLFLEDAFQTEVKRALAKKEEEDPNFQKGDFLSENELKKILDKLKYMMPLIDTGSQEFYLSGSSTAEVGDVKPFGMSLNNHFKTPATVYGPKDSGVSGIAAMNIGMVDGQMIQNFYWNGEVVGTLPVFDGINLPLDKLGEYSEKANKAIFDAWMGNAMKALSTSYDVFMKDTDTVAYIRNPQLKDKLAKAMLGQNATGDGVDVLSLTTWLNLIQDKLQSSAIDVETRHLAMKDIGAGIDQMAGFSSPHWHEGIISVEGMSDEQITEVLNKRKAFHRANVIKDQIKSEDISKDLEGFGLHELDSGAMAFYQQNLPLLGSKMNIPKDQKWMFDELTKSEALKDWTFITGTKEQIREEALKKGVLSEHLDNLEKGLMVQEQKLILLPTSSSETLVHEMMHAATFSTVYAYYNGNLTGAVAETVGAAIERLEAMMNQFRNLGEELPALSTETMQEYLHARSVIESQLSKVPVDGALAKASALNEFMAYTQSNQALIRLTKNTKVSSFLVQAAKAVLDFIKEHIWGKRTPRVNSDMYSNVRFNTALLARYQPSVASTMAAASTAVLPHSSPKTNLRLQAIRDNFLKRIPNHLKTPLTKDGVLTGKVTTKAIQVATEAAMSLNAHGLPMEPMEKSTFTSIVQTLATQAVIDPNTMARAQELFTLATKTLTVADFIDPSNTDAGSALYYANEQYNAVMGNYYEGKDALDRSTLLPVFMGLAMTNEKFRNVLSKLELPKTKLKEWNSLDSAFENAGNSLMDKLSLRLSGEGKHATNVQAAIDALTEHLMSTANDDLLTRMTEGFADWRETRLNKRNNRLLGYIDKGAKALHRTSMAALNNPQYGKFSQTLGKLGELTSAIINEDNAEIVAQGIVSTINKVDGFRTLREVIADIVGRTDSNAEIYDQNKLVRTMVSQDRQHYRDDLPGVILEQFSRTVTKEEMTAMFHGLGKTDIALLRESMKDAEIRELFTKPSALPMAIRAVETQLKTADPQHWNQVEKKAKQLANYMNGKGYGNNLLRNAESVANLFDEPQQAKRTKPDEAYIKAVDKLVSLYAIDGLSNENRSSLSSLVQNEAKGVDFVMAYLTGQRAEEMRKASASLTARMNYFKGFMPSSQNGNVTLVVSSDAEYSKLVGKSYTKVESYKGSSLLQGEPRSYYFANVPSRAAYNQGTMQNARQTAGGIDLATGFTDGLITAGRITDRKLVYRLAQNLRNERATTEPLLPVRSADGVIVAFERAVDPKQLERLNQSTDLAKMIGVWRGRQVEEAKVQVFNEALVDAAKKMYKTDLQNSSSKATEYINVFDPKEQKKDPVLADAVRLLNPETIKYIEDVFGKDTFMVRKDMANDMLGYRNATVGDLWSGNHRWSPETESAVKNLAISVFGNKAYQYMVNGERILQNVVGSAKTLIVMKSIIVPISNLLGNAYQLISRGVPLLSIAKGMPRKTLEVDAYSKSRRREVKVEALLRAAEGDVINTRKLSAELQSIRDSYRRMSIWPLIEAGQFSSISDMEVANEDVQLTSGKLHEYIESLVDKLPNSIRNAGRYALVTKDTALFQGLQKAVNYGDFIAKAVLYDDLTQRKGLTSKEALARITEEFVNYDRLPGRSRGYLESVGMLWFYNFKLRLVKIALSTIRNNPVHALVVGMMPKPDLFGSIGTPITDNLFSKAWSGSLSNSIGPGMLLNAPMLLPAVNAVFD